MLSQLAKKIDTRWEMMRQAIAMDQLVMAQIQKKPQGLLAKPVVPTAPSNKVPTCETRNICFLVLQKVQPCIQEWLEVIREIVSFIKL